MQQEIEHYIQQIDEGRRAVFLKLYQRLRRTCRKGLKRVCNMECRHLSCRYHVILKGI